MFRKYNMFKLPTTSDGDDWRYGSQIYTKFVTHGLKLKKFRQLKGHSRFGCVY